MFFDTRPSFNLSRFSKYQKILFSTSLFLLFWSLADGILWYIVPIQIIKLGFSTSQMGLIIASSNVFGMLFDFVLARYLVNTNYRRLFLIVFGLSSIYPLVLWSSKGVPLLLVSMAFWGLYGDLQNFATFDFVNRRVKKADHCQSYGIFDIFKGVGYLLAPIIAGIAITETLDFFPYSISISFLLISAIFYLVLVDLSPKYDSPEFDHTKSYKKFNFIKEFHIVKSIIITLMPVLIFNTLYLLYNGAIWTIGPIFGESANYFRGFGGYLMAAYTLPTLIISWYVGRITSNYGKKRTAYYSFLVSCLLLVPISFINNPYLIIFLVLLSSIGSSLSWPAIKGAYSDYISESHLYSKEIESLHDFTCNLGYIIGPVTAGVLADVFGIKNVFVILSSFSACIIFYLIAVTPKHITVRVSRR